MLKRISTLLFVFALATLPFWFMTVWAAPNATMRYVAVGGTDGANDCANPNNPCGSVVHAVQQTDAGDTVLIAAGQYTETDTIRIFRDVTIQGEGLHQTIIGVETNPDLWQVFQVFADVRATLSHLALHNADHSGIENIGYLTVTQVSVFENRGGSSGAGIYNTDTGVITVTDSLISNNGTAVNVAAGLMNFGQATLQRVLFVGNKASSYGGGLHNQGSLRLENVTFTLNEADSGTAVSNGGAGEIVMVNVTIARNINTKTSPISASAVSNYGQSIQAVNTIIADNGPNAQCSGDTAITSLGFNLDGHNGCDFDQPQDLIFTDPLLDTFATVTGSPNWVSALTFSINSPALDAGDSTQCPATDARGMTRPVGNGCDIGAYEFNDYRISVPLILR